VHLLDELVTADVRLAIATTGGAAWVLPLLDSPFGLDRFTVIVCGDDGSKLKPDPEAYLIVLKALRLNSDDAVVIEDSRHGLLAARRAGLRCLIVTNDYTALQDFAGAELGLDSLERPELSHRCWSFRPERQSTEQARSTARATPDPTRDSSGLRYIRRWRDPDSNRGHHDFQACASVSRIARKFLQISGTRTRAREHEKPANSVCPGRFGG
jgi:hypothetical protein